MLERFGVIFKPHFEKIGFSSKKAFEKYETGLFIGIHPKSFVFLSI